MGVVELVALKLERVDLSFYVALLIPLKAELRKSTCPLSKGTADVP